MEYLEVNRVETTEVIRLYRSGTGVSRDTERKSIAAAKEAGMAWNEPVPTEEQLSRLAGISEPAPGSTRYPTHRCSGSS